MAVIVKSDIIEDVNDNLLTNFATDGTELDRAINKVLSDMSKRGLLVGVDTSQSLASGNKTLDFPTGFRSAIAITLTDSSSNERPPLIKVPGGQRGYRRAVGNGANSYSPRAYAEFNEKIYLVGEAAEAYTVNIEYRKNHPKTPDAIEFSTDFENLMFAGATYYYAAKLGRQSALAIWTPIYRYELSMAVLNRKQQPSMMLG